MALQGTYRIYDQIDVADAYLKVEGVSGGKRGYSCNVQVFASKADSDAGKPPLAFIGGPGFSYVANECPIKLAYLACKADERFSTYQDA